MVQRRQVVVVVAAGAQVHRCTVHRCTVHRCRGQRYDTAMTRGAEVVHSMW